MALRSVGYGVRIHWTDGPVIATIVLVILLAIHNAYQPVFSAFQLQIIINNSVVLALAAMGETLVVLSGGFDLSPAAVIALANVVLVTQLNGSSGHDVLFVILVLLIGLGAGLLNGFFVAFMRLQSFIVTVATLFIFGGLALHVLKEPGGSAPFGFVNFLTGTIGSAFPRSLVVVFGAAFLWILLKRTSFGKALYAVGSDREAAFHSGIRVRRVVLIAFALAGLFYAAAGIFLTAQTTSGDPRVSSSLILTIFIAVVIGGTRFGGGYGSASGSIIGAFIVTMIVNVLFDIGIDSFYTGVVEGLVLLVAVLLSSLAQRLRAKRVLPPRAAAVGG